LNKPARIVYKDGTELVVAHHYRGEHGDLYVHIDSRDGRADEIINWDEVRNVIRLKDEALQHVTTGYVGINTQTVDEYPEHMVARAAARDMRGDP